VKRQATKARNGKQRTHCRLVLSQILLVSIHTCDI